MVLGNESPQHGFEPILSMYTYVVRGRQESPFRPPASEQYYLLAGFSDTVLKDDAGLRGTEVLVEDPDLAREADLAEIAFAGSSRLPTWVTYSPLTSEPRTNPVSVCSPTFEPSFQVNAALPLASLTARVGLTVPDFTENVTLASGTGFP